MDVLGGTVGRMMALDVVAACRLPSLSLSVESRPSKGEINSERGMGAGGKPSSHSEGGRGIGHIDGPNLLLTHLDK
jgi:hypothetical protein